jgi:hypothetical protein
MGEPYPCKARVTVLDSLSGVKIIDNNFVHCNDVENGGKFKHSRYKVTVHERVYAQKYLDEQQAIQDQKDREAQERADDRELRRILAEQERQKELDNNPTVIVYDSPIIEEVTTPISDVPNSINDVVNSSLYDTNVFKRVLSAIQNQNNTEQNIIPKKDNTNTILIIGGIGLVGLFILMKK